MPSEIRKAGVIKIHRSMPFTLIELLLVVTIIAILAGLLLPALKRAKDEAQEITCTGREKQIFDAVMLYADDYDNHVTPAWDGVKRWYFHLASGSWGGGFGLPDYRQSSGVSGGSICRRLPTIWYRAWDLTGREIPHG